MFDIRVEPVTTLAFYFDSVGDFISVCPDENSEYFSFVNFESELPDFLAFVKFDALVFSHSGPADCLRLRTALSFVVDHHNLERRHRYDWVDSDSDLTQSRPCCLPAF